MPSHLKTYGVTRLDEDGRIALELPCPACGFDLRGLSPDGACPECGSPIASATLRQRPRVAWRPLAVSSLLTALAAVFHAIYVARHAARLGPIDLFHGLAQWCALGVLACCVFLGVRAFRSRLLVDLLGFVGSLALLLIAGAVTMQTV